MSKNSKEIAEIAKQVAAELASQNVKAAQVIEAARVEAARVVANKAIETAATTNSTDDVKVAVLDNQMKTLTISVDKLSDKIDNLTIKIDDNYVKKEDFNPVKDTVEGLKYWQGKVIGYAAAVALAMELAFRLLTKNG
jgi:hypothetical protein